MQRVQTSASVILPLPSSEGRFHDADQRGGVKRSLQKADVSQCFHLSFGCRIAFNAGAALRKNYKRKIRPWRLRAGPMCETLDVCTADGLFRYHRQART